MHCTVNCFFFFGSLESERARWACWRRRETRSWRRQRTRGGGWRSSPSSSTRKRPSSRNSSASRVSGAVKILQEQFYFSWYWYRSGTYRYLQYRYLPVFWIRIRNPHASRIDLALLDLRICWSAQKWKLQKLRYLKNFSNSFCTHISESVVLGEKKLCEGKAWKRSYPHYLLIPRWFCSLDRNP